MSCDTTAHVGTQPDQVASADLLQAAWRLRGWDEGAVASATRRLSALCATRCELALRGPVWLPADEGRDPHGYVVSLIARDTETVCAWLELEGELARALVDVALGGTADTAELAFVEALDATREGVLLYLVASTLGSVPQDTLTIAGLAPAHAVVRPPRVACSGLVTLLGRSYGVRLSVAPGLLSAGLGVAAMRRTGDLPAWARESPCALSVELARGCLPLEDLHGLQPGDLLVPEEVWADGGTWSAAVLRCDGFDDPIAALHVDTSGALRATEGRPPHTLNAPRVDLTPFSVDAARVIVPLAELARWLEDGCVPLVVDATAPLTLFVAGQPYARGRLVRERGTVGLCVERVLYSSSGSPNSAA